MEIQKLGLSQSANEKLLQLGIMTVEKLLMTFPTRYDTYEKTPINQIDKLQRCVFDASVVSIPHFVFYAPKKSIGHFMVMVEGITLKCVIYNRHFLKGKLKENANITIIGRWDEQKNLFIITDIKLMPLADMKQVVAHYQLKGIIKDHHFQNYVLKGLEAIGSLETLVPNHLLEKYLLVNKRQAIYNMHFPTDTNQIKQGLRFIKYEEFFTFQVLMLAIAKLNEVEVKENQKKFEVAKVETFLQTFPFEFTKDQKSALDDILEDMSSKQVMYRLVQGDVGCGKTAVAMGAIYANFLAGFQSVFMAPTEILAKQHFTGLKQQFENTDVVVECLVGKQTLKEKQSILTRLQNGEIDIIVGTHALIQPTVVFKNLGLVITDEQQRFGVKQRQLLKEKGQHADFLLMSATPIPRTLAIALFKDMKLSTIRTMPKGRLPVITKYIRKNSIKSILDEITEYLKQGMQMYVVCPSIEESELVTIKDATTIYQSLTKYYHRQFRVGLLHGRQSQKEKDEVMARFKNHEVDILVSTTVIEVGIHVSNANLMVIYDANRFGLSQLHQLRGRIGRDECQGRCYLLSNTTQEDAVERLSFFEKNTDGFTIAEYDLKMRGAGDILGSTQSGQLPFIFADIYQDFNILELARIDANKVINDIDSHPELAKKIQLALSNNISMID